MRLFTLFISYSFGGHYCGVYPSLEDVSKVIEEMMADMEIDDEVTDLKEIAEKLNENDDFWHEFSDRTWIHVQEVSEQLVNQIKEEVWK